MKRGWLGVLLLCLASIVAMQARADDEAVVLRIHGAIGPATTDYLTRALDEAAADGASLVVLTIDTPGGLVAATRDIVQAILASPVPVACYTSPSGARAASAGTYIMYSCHVAAMAPATSIGAATPVSIGGGFNPLPKPTAPKAEKTEKADQDKDKNKDKNKDKDQTEPAAAAPQGDAMAHKVLNDAVSFIRGLAAKRGRNVEWAEKAVREAVTLTAAEALEQHVIDLVATDIADLLQQIDGREVSVGNSKRTLSTAGLTLRRVEPDWRSELLSVITDPQIAYFLLLAGIYGLLLEGYHPGATLPGVVGAISLLLALFAFQVLPVNYAGLALILLGAVLMAAEAFVPSFGVLGIGGIVALVFGSIMLMDTRVPGYEVSRSVIATVAAVSGIIVLAMGTLAASTLRMKRVLPGQALIGASGIVVADFEQDGQVLVEGEIWRAHSAAPLRKNDRIRVDGQHGLTIDVSALVADPTNKEATS